MALDNSVNSSEIEIYICVISGKSLIYAIYIHCWLNSKHLNAKEQQIIDFMEYKRTWSYFIYIYIYTYIEHILHTKCYNTILHYIKKNFSLAYTHNIFLYKCACCIRWTVWYLAIICPLNSRLYSKSVVPQ